MRGVVFSGIHQSDSGVSTQTPKALPASSCFRGDNVKDAAHASDPQKHGTPSQKGFRLALGAAALMLAATLAGWAWYLSQGDDEGSLYRRLAKEIRRRTQLPVIFFRTEVHELAFHVGRPLDTIREWENLEVWATRARPVYMVMPPDCAAAWPHHLRRGRLEEVLRTTTPHARPLVIMRSVPAECLVARDR